MAEKTGIEWTGATWNPVTGCSKVSAGCKHCYAERDWKRLSANHKTRYYGRKFTDVQCHGDVLNKPLGWRKPREIFVNSMSDLFHPDVPDHFIDEVFGVMWACLFLGNEPVPGHIFQVLTKRPERMLDYLSKDRRRIWADSAATHGGGYDPDGIWDQTANSSGVHPRIWLGVSVEDQQTADERIPLLLQTPAAVRWLSMEPLLGEIHLNPCWIKRGCGLGNDDDRAITSCLECNNQMCAWPSVKIDWVVVGGESGHNARPMHPDWAESLQQQCEAAGVSFFFKQWGEWAPRSSCYHTLTNGMAAADIDPSAIKWPCIRLTYSGGNGRDIANACSSGDDVYMQKVGRKLAGRLLYGREFNEYPRA